MNKSDIVSRVAAQASLSRAAADNVVNAVFTAIGDGLAQDEAVAIAGFGTFSIKQRPSRSGRNPRTGVHHNRGLGGSGIQGAKDFARRGALAVSVADAWAVARASR